LQYPRSASLLFLRLFSDTTTEDSMKRCVTAMGALFALTATACSGSGELGHGTFHYECTTDYDFSCDVLGSPGIDGAVAVGATFDLEYLRSSTDIAARQTFGGVHPASPLVAENVASGAQRGMRFLVPGEGAFLARGADDSVIDFIHLFAEEVVDVELTGPSVLVDGMGMTPGETATVTAYPLGPGGEQLVGSMLCTWSTDDGSVIATPAGSQSCAIDVDALTSGITTLHVEMNDAATASLTVTVEDPS
jgi:hypothetical protein